MDIIIRSTINRIEGDSWSSDERPSIVKENSSSKWMRWKDYNRYCKKSGFSFGNELRKYFAKNKLNLYYLPGPGTSAPCARLLRLLVPIRNPLFLLLRSSSSPLAVVLGWSNYLELYRLVETHRYSSCGSRPWSLESLARRVGAALIRFACSIQATRPPYSSLGRRCLRFLDYCSWIFSIWKKRTRAGAGC